MSWIKRKFLLLIALLLVYTTYFIFHSHAVSTPQTLGVQTSLSLIEEPKDGKQPILQILNNATKQIDMEVYLLSDKDVIKSLLDACQRGVVVRVMLEEHPFGGGNINAKTALQLKSSCVRFQWSNPSFALTHEKTVAIDNSIALILTQNLTESAFTKNREYDILDTNQTDVSEIEKIFNADWTRSYFLQKDRNLIVSPISSRETLTSLISDTSKEIDIEMEVIDDPMIIHLLSQKAKQSTIHIILPSFAKVSSNRIAAQDLSNAGAIVKIMDVPYLHAKLMLFDNVKAYVGSVNLTSQSMDENREVGIVLSKQDIIGNLQEDFVSDWENAQTFSN